MHEVGLVKDAVQQAVEKAREAGAERIDRITFGVKPDGHATPEAVATLFSTISLGTLAEGAEVEIEQLETPIACFACGTVFTATSSDATCPTCGGAGMPDGEVPDLRLVSIEIPD